MTREELMPLAKTYFVSNPLLPIIYGTGDQHFFFEKVQAQRHCGKDIPYFPFIAEDFAKKKKVVPKKTEPKIEAKKGTSKKED